MIAKILKFFFYLVSIIIFVFFTRYFLKKLYLYDGKVLKEMSCEEMKEIEITKDFKLYNSKSISNIENILKEKSLSEEYKAHFSLMKDFLSDKKLEEYLTLSFINNTTNIKVLSHSDLHQHNVMIRKNECFFIDFEHVCYASLGSDLIKSLLFLESYEKEFNIQKFDDEYFKLFNAYVKYFYEENPSFERTDFRQKKLFNDLKERFASFLSQGQGERVFNA